jgi:hypothetical protein
LSEEKAVPSGKAHLVIGGDPFLSLPLVNWLLLQTQVHVPGQSSRTPGQPLIEIHKSLALWSLD